MVVVVVVVIVVVVVVVAATAAVVVAVTHSCGLTYIHTFMSEQYYHQNHQQHT